MLNKLTCPLLISSQSDYLIQVVDTNSHINDSVDPDQLASSEAKWPGSKLFVKAGIISVQQGQG